MRLFIRHATRYRYSAQAHYTIQYLRLTPSSDGTQNVQRWNIRAPGRLTRQIDGYGNVLHVMVIDKLHEEMEIVAEGVVESFDTAGVQRADDGRFPPALHLRETALTEATAEVRDFAEPLRRRIAADRLDGLHELSRAVAAAVAYRPGSTDVDTPAAAALTAGSGVCQDQAHVFTAAARFLGVPTRYVSGYVHVEGNLGDTSDSHAWSESWVEDLGWVAFDVTNAICANDAHVRLAVGPDYAACAPIRGVRRGGGREFMEVNVTVAAEAQTV